MAADPRWNKAWLLIFLVVQFLFALILLAINGQYQRKYGGVVATYVVPAATFGSDVYPATTDNVMQFATPLKYVRNSFYLHFTL